MGPGECRGRAKAVVLGDPTKPGFYMVYNKWTKGNHFSRPHFHPNDRYIVVLQGTWWVGSGPKFDPQNGTVPMPAGSFVTHYGKQVHWDGAKDEDTILLIMGEGPATSTLAEAEITPPRAIYSANVMPGHENADAVPMQGVQPRHRSRQRALACRQGKAVAHHRHSLPLPGARSQRDGAEGNRHRGRRRDAERQCPRQ